MDKHKVLVTGANGFIGRRLCRRLRDSGFFVSALLRRPDDGPWAESFCVEFGKDELLAESLAGVQTIIHLAAKVHALSESSGAEDEYQQINVIGTESLASMAAAAGVSRFVFFSSVKVNGEQTGLAHFTEEDSPAPQDPYAVSKLAAEKALHKVAAASALEVVIVRLPLVYGPGVKANFLQLLKLAGSGLPLPFAGLENRRSLLFLDNLVDFLLQVIDNPAAAGETFLVSDDEDVSTQQLVRMIAGHLDRPARLFPVPLFILRFVAGMLGKKAVYDRLCGSLQVDVSKAKRLLNWKPPVTVDQGLRQTIAWYLQDRKT